MKKESVDGIYKLTVPEKPIYNVSNHIFYNYGSGPGGVLVQNNKKQNTTIASGYYLITGLPDGIYNVSFSKDSYDGRGQKLPILNFKTAPRSDKK
ncbi:hypothetical protein [Candidatus Methanoperedens nitratireducens]|uniref:Carboxypeptidase regulatory-like domain-containing protein n=1 Tax=Candidatus Methanoperedens nitratireducens TaxID=1392998 RepID=A0A284VSM1_9EURY|nr:hypothetical protein [Candidatus Methanoperedens nitroreducens]SNQ62284.1 hypothetical protein MNV_660022 [Candidatus Methanoperedens nitroreducens]